ERDKSSCGNLRIVGTGYRLNPNNVADDASPDWLAITAQSCLVALGMVSVLLAPLPVLYAHLKFPDPYSKICALVGAAFAVAFSGLSAGPAVILFVFSLFL